MDELGAHLRRLREARALSLREAAELTSTPHTNLSAYENGSRNLGRTVLTRIVDAYDRALPLTPAERRVELTWFTDAPDDVVDGTAQVETGADQADTVPAAPAA